MLHALGSKATKNELNDIIDDMDLDGSGTIDFAEFVILLTSKMTDLSVEEEINVAFSVLDSKKDGNLDLAELKYFMRKVAFIKISDEEAQAMIQLASPAGSGLVSHDEFLDLVTIQLEAEKLKVVFEESSSEESSVDSEEEKQ